MVKSSTFLGVALVGMKDEEEVAKKRKLKKAAVKKQQEEMRQQMMQGRMPQRPPQDALGDSNLFLF